MHNLFLKVLILIVALLNVWLFWPGDLYFLNDDLLHIPLTDKGELLQTRSARPVHELLVALDLQLWGKQAFGYHVTALLLHAVVCVQLYLVSQSLALFLLSLRKETATKVSLLAVLLFLCYAQHSEALGWILGRTPVLATIFLFGSLQLFLPPRLNTSRIVAGSLLFGISLFTYEQAILFPLMLAILAWYNKELRWRKKQRAFVLFSLVVAAGYLVVRKIVAIDIVGAYEGEHFTNFNIGFMMANAFRLMTRLWLNPFYEIYFASTAVLFLLLAFCIWKFRKELKVHLPAVTFFITTIVVLLLPIVSLGIAVRSFESGRFMYMPSLFLAMAMGIVLVGLYYQPKYQNLVVLAGGLICSYWLWGKYEASKDYKLASAYAQQVQERVAEHFSTSAEPLLIDTLHLSVERLPVYRLGFKTGAKWLYNVDTSLIVVKHQVDHVAK